MCLKGRITPINRNGINKISNISSLRKASFETTVDILNSAAVFSKKDSVNLDLYYSVILTCFRLWG